MARLRACASLALASGLACAGCRVSEQALVVPEAGVTAVDASWLADAMPDARPPRERPPEPDLAPPVPVVGLPVVVGCADGSREAFLDLAAWPAIAGCSGAFSEPGLVGERGRAPACDRNGGDEGRAKDGVGCRAADLCALGWHVCGSPLEVADRSPSGCEGAIPSHVPAFYAAAIGAAPSGRCYPDATLRNDLHGCGRLGQSEDESCAPFVRRMGFADCFATESWSCGTAAEFDREALVVSKAPGAGGVLCCRDILSAP